MKDALGHGSNPRGTTSTVGVFAQALALSKRQQPVAAHSTRIHNLPRSMTNAAQEKAEIGRRVDARHYNTRNAR